MASYVPPSMVYPSEPRNDVSMHGNRLLQCADTDEAFHSQQRSFVLVMVKKRDARAAYTIACMT